MIRKELKVGDKVVFWSDYRANPPFNYFKATEGVVKKIEVATNYGHTNTMCDVEWTFTEKVYHDIVDNHLFRFDFKPNKDNFTILFRVDKMNLSTIRTALKSNKINEGGMTDFLTFPKDNIISVSEITKPFKHKKVLLQYDGKTYMGRIMRERGDLIDVKLHNDDLFNNEQNCETSDPNPEDLEEDEYEN